MFLLILYILIWQYNILIIFNLTSQPYILFLLDLLFKNDWFWIARLLHLFLSILLIFILFFTLFVAIKFMSHRQNIQKGRFMLLILVNFQNWEQCYKLKYVLLISVIEIHNLMLDFFAACIHILNKSISFLK